MLIKDAQLVSLGLIPFTYWQAGGENISHLLCQSISRGLLERRLRNEEGQITRLNGEDVWLL